MIGLLRFLFVAALVILARRIFRGVLASRRRATGSEAGSHSRTSPDGRQERGRGDDLGSGQRIEEADYEELD